MEMKIHAGGGDQNWHVGEMIARGGIKGILHAMEDTIKIRHVEGVLWAMRIVGGAEKLNISNIMLEVGGH